MRTLVIIACLTGVCLTAADQTGVVRSAGLPIPGATVTASRDGQKITTYTDERGACRPGCGEELR